MNKKVCIFCGANTGNDPKIVEKIKLFCDLLIDHDFDLVYGGGGDGLMGLIADQFLAGGRQVIGIRPKKLLAESEHRSVTEMLIVEDMYERKAKMLEISNAFIALPGGIGTLDEVMEVHTHVKLKYISGFCGVLNINNYYEGLDMMLTKMVKNGYLKESDRQLLQIIEEPEVLLNKLLDSLKQ